MCAFTFFPQLAAAAEIDEEPVSKAKQSRSEKKARKVRGASSGVVTVIVLLYVQRKIYSSNQMTSDHIE